MSTYITIIITALLGIIGLVLKTQKDDKPSLFNKLTPFGFIVLILMLIAFTVSIFSQREDDILAENEKKEILEKS